MTTDSSTVVVVATIHPLPEHRAEVIAALTETIERVHLEDEGCLLYALNEGDDRLVMIEKWSSAEALAIHGEGASLAELRTRLAGRIDGELDVQVLRAHPAGTAAQGVL